jgi:hypothetical protein
MDTEAQGLGLSFSANCTSIHFGTYRRNKHFLLKSSTYHNYASSLMTMQIGRWRYPQQNELTHRDPRPTLRREAIPSLSKHCDSECCSSSRWISAPP